MKRVRARESCLSGTFGVLDFWKFQPQTALELFLFFHIN